MGMTKICSRIIPAALALALLAASMALPGCATLRPVVDNLPKAVAYAQDAELVVTGLETFEKGYYMVKPNPAQQAIVENGIADARSALDAGIRICEGTTELSASQVDLAFSDFRKAYIDVVGLLGPIGVKRGTPGTRMGASPGGYVAPDPLLLRS